MRRDAFLRTPIRADHQALLQNLSIADVPLLGNPDPANPYPQTLEIRFDIAASTTEVQIALPWEGLLQFRPDSTLNHPAAPSDVTVVRYPTWAVVGDLLLRTFTLFGSGSGLQDAFTTHLPLVSPFPAIVRFSKVRLTQDFLFTTLGALRKYRFMFEGATVASEDPLRLQKLIIKFLSGETLAPCKLDPADAAKDQTLLAMPSVELGAAGATTTFRIAVASASENGLWPTWFTLRPEDAISGEPLVPAAIDNFTEQVTNPAHPHHSVIPTRLIFQRAAAAAYAPDHGAATPLRAALAAPLAGGLSYRKIEVVRPPLPLGSEVSSAATRPYPMYRLCWTPVGGGATESVRLPLSGRVYLPLADGSYRFWVIPRSADPTDVDEGDHVRLSLKAAAPARYIDVPKTMVAVALGTAQSVQIFAHTHQYDSRMVWEGFKRVSATRRRRLQETARAAWQLPYVGCVYWNILQFANDGNGQIEITTSSPHPLKTSVVVPVTLKKINPADGTVEKEERWDVKRTGASTCILQESSFSGSYAGTWSVQFGHGVCNWYVLPIDEREDYKDLYGYIRESAGRHGLAPEFLQVVFFGEGAGGEITPSFDPNKPINAFGFAGLDLILYRTGRLPVGARTVPLVAVDHGDPDEIAEYSYNLVTEGYLDTATAEAVTPAGTEENELRPPRLLHVARINGWKAAIELVAAEIHARLDEMTKYLAGNMPPIAVNEDEENRLRFLAYLRYSASPATARGHADNLYQRLRPWGDDPFPPLGVASEELPHFLSIQRIAVTEWQEAAAVYRAIIE